MAPTNPTDHELNAVLARVAGVQVRPADYAPDRTWVIASNGFGRWDPLHDANQMEMAEAWLRENEWEYITGWSRQGSNHWAELRNTKKAFWSCDPDKKRAFALAIWQMEQSNNNNNKED